MPGRNLDLHKGIKNTGHGNYLVKCNTFSSYYYTSLKHKVKMIAI